MRNSMFLRLDKRRENLLKKFPQAGKLHTIEEALAVGDQVGLAIGRERGILPRKAPVITYKRASKLKDPLPQMQLPGLGKVAGKS